MDTVLTEILRVHSNGRVPPTAQQIFLNRYYFVVCVQMIIAGKVKGLKKGIIGVMQNQFKSEEELTSRFEAELFPIWENNITDTYQFIVTHYSDTNSFFVSHKVLISMLEYNRYNFAKAIELCSSVSSNDIVRLSLLGSSYFAMGSVSLAISCYKRIIPFMHIYDRALCGSVYKNLGIMYDALQETESAHLCFQEALRYLPRNAHIWYYYGEHLTKMAIKDKKRSLLWEIEMAIDTALQLKASEPLRLECLLRKIWLKIQLRCFEEACALCDEAEMIVRRNVSQLQLIHLYRSNAFFELNKVEEAIKELDPLMQRRLYPECIVKVLKKEKVDCISDYCGRGSYCEMMLYNYTQVVFGWSCNV